MEIKTMRFPTEDECDSLVEFYCRRAAHWRREEQRLREFHPYVFEEDIDAKNPVFKYWVSVEQSIRFNTQSASAEAQLFGEDWEFMIDLYIKEHSDYDDDLEF